MSVPSGRTRLATLLLVGVTAVWGSTFFLIRDLVETVPPADFLTVRFGIAAIVMVALFRRQTLALGRRDLSFCRSAASSRVPTSCSPRSSGRCCCASTSGP